MSTFGAHIPPVQLSEEQLRAAIGRAGLQPGERYVELGSGEGNGLLLAAREFGARAAGVEIDDAAVRRTSERAAIALLDVDVRAGDVLDYDPGGADVVLLHLGPAFHDLLAPRLEQLLPATARVVTWGWEVPGWIPEDDPEGFDEPCFVYRPADPRWSGRWDGAGLSRAAAAGERVVDAALFHAGADLRDIEVRVTGDIAGSVSADAADTTIDRGQTLLVELRWNSPASGVAAGTLELWARSRSGRFTQRGTPLPVALQAAG